MELKEVSATKISPYRCYVRGNIIQTEGENVQTIGFKNGIAVVQVTTTDIQKSQDNMIDDNKAAIDLTKLKKIIVKIDPVTNKKYIFKDGKKIEILPQITNPILNFKPLETKVKIKSISKANTTQTGPPPEETTPRPILFSNLKKILNGTELPKLVPTSSAYNRPNIIKSVDNVKYHVLSVNVKKPCKVTMATMTDKVPVDKILQTDSLNRKTVCTQTDPLDGDSPFSETFINFILGDSYNETMQRRMIDPTKLKTKEDINKFNFFNDMRNALNFDNSGNLPIHDSVMQNNLKTVQKNCVVLRALKESVNILNQQCYAPLHLAVLHDVDLEVVKVLLDHGADLGIPDSEGNTAIHLAIEHKRSTMLKILVDGAKSKNFSLDVFNYEGFTPLILACLNGSFFDAKLLLQHGADPNVKDMKSGRTALFHAAECHDVNLVELLMQYKADTKIRNFFGTSPHDAMFELEEIPLKIKFSILGREHQRFQLKKKIEGGKTETTIKKPKLQTTPVLRKVTTSDLLSRSRRK